MISGVLRSLFGRDRSKDCFLCGEPNAQWRVIETDYSTMTGRFCGRCTDAQSRDLLRSGVANRVRANGD
jgi:hypothetical protein